MAKVPFVLWASLWAHPRTLPHAASYLVVRHLYRHADAIVTYGPHVSAYVRAQGATNPVVEAPQSVDNEYWIRQSSPIRRAAFQAAFVGRIAGEKGPQVLIQAWSSSGLSALSAALVLVGGGPIRARAVATGAVLSEGPQPPAEVRNFYAGSDVVVVPSVATRDFREPWGLVVNEAFNQGVPVIATDAVGAVAGGLVRHERTGLVVPAGDAASPRRRAAPHARRARAARARSAPPRARRSRPTRTTRGRPGCRRPCKARERAVASVEGHGSSADAQRADPAARCSTGERAGRPREDPARVPGGPHHRRLHAEAAPRRAQPHPDRHRRVLRLPRRALAGRADRPRRGRRRRGTNAPGGVRPDDGRSPLTPSDPVENAELSNARLNSDAQSVGEQSIIPGAAGFDAAAERHGLPTSVLVVLILLGLCARRRDVRVRPPTCHRSQAALARGSARGRGRSPRSGSAPTPR